MDPLESYCSLHCTFVFCSKLQQQVNSMFPLIAMMCAMICWGLLLLGADAVVAMKHIRRLVQAHPVLDENLQWSHLSRIAVCIVRLCFVANCSKRSTACFP